MCTRDFCVVAICEEGVVRSAGRVPSTLEGLRPLVDAEIAAVDKLIARQALEWPEIRRLMTVSGGNLSAPRRS